MERHLGRVLLVGGRHRNTHSGPQGLTARGDNRSCGEGSCARSRVREAKLPRALLASQKRSGSGKSVSVRLRVQQQRQQTLRTSETPTRCASGGTIYIYFLSLWVFLFLFLFLPKLQNSKCKALSINSSTFTKLYTHRYTHRHSIRWSPARPLSKNDLNISCTRKVFYLHTHRVKKKKRLLN